MLPVSLQTKVRLRANILAMDLLYLVNQWTNDLIWINFIEIYYDILVYLCKYIRFFRLA
jgi:hypothetical protein